MASLARRARQAGLALAVAMVPHGVGGTPAVWQDNTTGLAIGGIDPLTYHTRAVPLRGDRDHELAWGGAIWRFVNAGNRDAFARHPEIYAPAFAGFDVHALSQGRAVAGYPTLWRLYGGRLYLFHSEANQAAWAADPDGVIERAQAQWPRIAAELPRRPAW